MKLTIDQQHKIEKMVHMDFMLFGKVEVWQLRGTYLVYAPSGHRDHCFCGCYYRGNLGPMFDLIENLQGDG